MMTSRPSRHSSAIRAVPLLAIALSLHAVALHAALTVPELFPNLARGERADMVIDRLPIDEPDGWTGGVNLFNGNLMLSRSFGRELSIEHGLSYRFELHYNSQFWGFDAASGGQATPIVSNAGVGWNVGVGGFGEIWAPNQGYNRSPLWLYVDPQGGAHSFYSTLHVDTPDVDDPLHSFFYSRDGSNLRLRVDSASALALEFPDGRILELTLAAGSYRPTRLVRVGGVGSLTWSYPIDGSWQLTDSHGRTQRVFFATDGSGARRVSRIETLGIGGAVASYTFAYSEVSILRPCGDPRGGGVTASVLTSITDAVGRVVRMEYSGTSCNDSGRLTRATMTTGGALAVTYGAWSHPPFSCSTSTPWYLTNGVGVTRIDVQGFSTTSVGAWTYVSTLQGNASACLASSRRTIVTEPLGHTSQWHFAAATHAAAGSPALYALPISPTSAGPIGGTFLTRRLEGGGVDQSTYQAWAQDEACLDIQANCFDTHRRMTRERTVFADDLVSGVARYSGTIYSDWDGFGHFRRWQEEGNFGPDDTLIRFTRWNASNGTYVPFQGGFVMKPTIKPWILEEFTEQKVSNGAETVVESIEACFDQGRILRMRRRSRTNAAVASSNDVLTVTSWSGGLPNREESYGGDIQPIPTGDLCTLSLAGLSPQYRVARTFTAGFLATEGWVDAGNTVVALTTDRDVDASTGLTTATRDAAGLITRYEYDLGLRRTWVKPDIQHGGAWQRFTYRAPTGTSGWSDGIKRDEITFEPGGVVERMRRVTWIDPWGHEAGSEARLPSGLTSRRRSRYDAAGRLIAQTAAFAPGQTTLPWTDYSEFDALGRVGRVRPPEGAAHDRIYTYRGVRERVVTESAARAFSNGCFESPMTTTVRFDRQGNQVWEREDRPQPAPGFVRELTSGRDLRGREISRTEITTVGTESRTRTRTEIWDGRGFLLWSFDGGDRSRREDFLDRDARGLAQRHRITEPTMAPPPGVETRRIFDLAGRLVRIEDATARVWKEWTWGTSNVTLPDGRYDARRGKVALERRHNWRNGIDFIVEATKTYAGRGGRLSNHSLVIRRSDNFPQAGLPRRYDQSATYDVLGNAINVGYPSCLQCASGEPALARTLTSTFDGWLPKSLSSQIPNESARSLISSIGYDLSFLPTSLVHGNGVSDLQLSDPFGLARPSRLQVDDGVVGCGPGCSDYDSGLITYDGRGEMCGRGDVSTVVVPQLEAVMEAPCAAGIVRDPFGVPTGRSSIVDCDDSPKDIYYDVLDRAVVVHDMSAKTEVLVGSEYQYLSDPSKWTWTTKLFDAFEPGRVLRSVESSSSGVWKSTHDRFETLGRLVGEETRKSGVSTPVVRHVHHSAVRDTDQNGLPFVE